MTTKNNVAPPPSPASAPTASTGLDTLAITLVIIAGVVSALHVGKAPIAVPQMQQEFNRSLAGLSWVMSVFPIVGMIGGLIAGILVQRQGDRSMLILGLVILGAASMAAVALPSCGWLITTRVVEGLGFLLIVVAAPAVLNRLTPPERRLIVFGIWSCFMGAGISLSMLLGPVLGDWHVLWIVDGALALLIAFGVALKVRPAASNKNQALSMPTSKEIWSVAGSPAPLFLALAFGAYNLQFFAFMSFLPSFLMEHAHLTLPQAGIAAAITVAANMFGNLLAGWSLQRGARPAVLLAFTFAINGVLGSLIYLAPLSAWALIALCVIFSAIAGIIPGTCIATAPRIAPKPALAALSLGVLMQGNYLGQVVGPVMLGALMASWGWAAAGGQIAVAAVFGVALAVGFQKARRA
ncbi:MFS transporter [Diaphorobacter sp. HDW4B]|uniref:MFS transporter n=1 Tax=Diaphorobacter sp. HDW4B TaxID=2714925 RepID=UPI00140D5A62|nr:MFS transporter [Diaphorobacter sp. HDW4B]QIL73054.1 MFS transporter [Diaphorobacter sp. HDW4B]